MCGIAVAIGWEGADAAVASLIAGILHRGDITDPIVSLSSSTAMCTRRLRIVDGHNAVQPFWSFDGGLVVAFNGEIYNHKALRAELSGLGIRFRTRSDTEVLANALRVWGAAALQRLIGMYAFVALEIDSGEFIAARDPFGVKPLYLIKWGPGYLFCSEIRPLLATSELGDVLLLPPGHLLMRKVFAPFRSPVADPRLPSRQHATAELDELLAKAVDARAPPDLPFATLFSGGIDSTLIAHYARQVHPRSPGYFLGDEGRPDHQYAVQYAEQTGYDLRYVSFDVEADSTLAVMDDVILTSETFEPEVIHGSICSYLLARRVHEDGFRVALCGEGADELFAGYRHLEAAFAAGDEIGQPIREQCLAGMHRTNLQRIDRCTMRFQIETREPFLDPSIVNYALSLQATDLVETFAGRPRGKQPLRRLYDLYPGQLPVAIRDREKVPFNEGAGFDGARRKSPWERVAEDMITDREFEDGKREFAAYDLRNKEELLYLTKLQEGLDVARVPHLSARMRLVVPTELALRSLREFII